MLKVTIELLPGGDAEMRRTLGVMYITNKSSLADKSDYEISAAEGPNSLTEAAPWTCVTRVEGHDRRQSVWKIVEAAAASLRAFWGGAGYAPVKADYDGDGKADLATYVASTGSWYILLSGSNYTTTITKNWGGAGYAAVPQYP